MLYIILMHISHFIFSLMTYYLLSIFILYYKNDVRQKQTQEIFLFECGKAAETTHNINNTFGPGMLTNIQCSGASRNFTKEMRALKMSVVAGHQKLTTTSWEPSLKLILLQLHEKLLRAQHQPIYSHSPFEANRKSERPP